MNISTWAIHNPIPSILLFILLFSGGIYSFDRLPITRYPNVDIPVVIVSASQHGATAQQMTDQILRPIEDAVSNVKGVRHIWSSAHESSASLRIDFEIDINAERAQYDVEDAIANVRHRLPPNIPEPRVQRSSVTDEAILTYAVSSSAMSIADISSFVDDVVVPEFESKQSVGRVTRFGGIIQRIQVELKPDRLLALDITAAEVSDQVIATNVDLGSGTSSLARQRHSIRTVSRVASLESLAALPIMLTNGQAIRLEILADIMDDRTNSNSFAFHNGKRVIAVQIHRAIGESEIKAEQEIKDSITTLTNEHADLSLSLIDETIKHTKSNYSAAKRAFVEGSIITVLVVFAFLRNLRATIITSLSLPLSLVPTFFVIDFLGFSLNVVSLLAITLVIGILIDDAIVEMENINRHISMGASAVKASENAVNEIALTVIAISISIVAVFIPVSFMSGIPGQYFREFGITLSISVIFSLLVARLITPMLSAYFLKTDRGLHRAHENGFLVQSYSRILTMTLRHRTATIISGSIVSLASLFSVQFLQTELLPKSGEGRTNVSIELPPGSLMTDTIKIAERLSTQFFDLDGVDSVFSRGLANSAKLFFVIRSTDDEEGGTTTLSAIRERLSAMLAEEPDIKVDISGASGQQDVQMIVAGASIRTVSEVASQLAEEMNQIDALSYASSSTSYTSPEIHIIRRPEVATQFGITPTDLASTIRVATMGASSESLSKFVTMRNQIPITVRVADNARNDMQGLGKLRIRTRDGDSVPLALVANLVLARSPVAIQRYDGLYQGRVQATLDDSHALGSAIASIDSLPIVQNMPKGAEISKTGDSQLIGEFFSAFTLAMITGILLLYAVLTILFSSFFIPLAIILSLPLSIGGAVLALYLFGGTFSLPVLIGMLMLMGIVAKNAIMLVDFANQGIIAGIERDQAILDAGKKRVMPIIMTTVAMSGGMLPTALGSGVGSEFRTPMATAVLGGLVSSTIFSLLLVPSFFSMTIQSLKLVGDKVSMKSTDKPDST